MMIWDQVKICWASENIFLALAGTRNSSNNSIYVSVQSIYCSIIHRDWTYYYSNNVKVIPNFVT